MFDKKKDISMRKSHALTNTAHLQGVGNSYGENGSSFLGHFGEKMLQFPHLQPIFVAYRQRLKLV